MRSILTIYLTLMIAAGPWVCCCGTAALPASASSSLVPASRSCCHSEKPTTPAPEHAPVRPCSCQDNRSSAVLDSTDSELAAVAQRSFSSFALFVTDFDSAALLGAVSLPTTEQPVGSFDSRDILRHFRVLRC